MAFENTSRPTLPPIHSSERLEPVEYQPVQGKLQIVNPADIDQQLDSEQPESQ